MTWIEEQAIADQRVADLRRDADHDRLVRTARGARARRRARGLRGLLWPARPVATARSATETLGMIFSPSWPSRARTPLSSGLGH